MAIYDDQSKNKKDKSIFDKSLFFSSEKEEKTLEKYFYP